MNIDYEKAKPSDFEEIYTVMQTSARELSRKAYDDQLLSTFDTFYIEKSPDYISQTLENKHNYTIVAKDIDNIIGFIQLQVHKGFGTISHLYILPGYEGKSIGTNLVSIIKRKALQLNIQKLTIESTLNALSYYEKFGFTNKGLIPDGSAYDLELEL